MKMYVLMALMSLSSPSGEDFGKQWVAIAMFESIERCVKLGSEQATAWKQKTPNLERVTCVEATINMRNPEQAYFSTVPGYGAGITEQFR